MNWIKQFGFDSGRLCQMLGIDAAGLLRVGKKERELLAYSGIGWNDQQHAAFQLACGVVAGLGYGMVFVVLALAFGLNPVFILLALPCAFFGVIAARLHIAGLAREKERCVEANMLDALRHFASELKSGRSLMHALSEVGRGSYGAVSGLVCGALVLVREGESVETAFRETAERTPSHAFRSFAASVAHAHSSGADVTGVVERFAKELETSRKSALVLHANECSKLSTLTVVLTGVLPGLLIFALVEGGFVFGFRAPVELFLVSYLLAFPVAKYALQARLALSSPGV